MQVGAVAGKKGDVEGIRGTLQRGLLQQEPLVWLALVNVCAYDATLHTTALAYVASHAS